MTGPMIRRGRDEILATVRAVVHPWLAAARRHGPLPAVGSDEFAVADWTVQVAVLLVCGEAWVAEDPRQAVRRVMTETSREVHGGDAEFWRQLAAAHVSHDEMQRRRYPPEAVA